MQVIGFNFTKISATREKNVSKPIIDTHIEFVDLEKAEINLLKDSEASALNFKYTILYSAEKNSSKKEDQKESQPKQAEIAFEGNVVLALSKEKSKEMHKSWDNKTIPDEFQVPLYNLILRKCTPRAIHIAEEIALPSPVPLPRISGQKKN